MHMLRLVLLLGVILGVVLPKSSAALADMGVIDDHAVVICTGHGLVEVSLDRRDTEKQNAATHDHVCLLVHALDHVATPMPPMWVRLASRFQPRTADHLWRPMQAPLDGFARAPPRA